LHESGVYALLGREQVGPILAAISCNYRRQINFPDTVHVGARITRLGRSSFAMEHAVYSQSQLALVAEGDSTIVVFDYATHQSQRISDAVRRRISEFEGREFPARPDAA
jgi:acyl-CoA thioester hydrolase